MTRGFLRAGHLPTLVAALLYFDVSFMIWVLLGALGNYVAADFGLSPAQKGFMTAVPLLGGSLLRLVFGQLSDRIGGKRTGCIGLVATLTPLLAGWLWADSISKVYLVGLLLGLAGASFAVALPMASRWYPAKYQGLAMGIAGAGNSGTLLATLFAPRLAEAYGWHAVFGLAILPLAIVTVIFMIFAKDAPRPARRRRRVDFAAALEIGLVLFLERCRDCRAPGDPLGRGNQRLVPPVRGEVTCQLREIRRSCDMEIVEKGQDMGMVGVAHRLNPPSTIRVCPVT